MEKVRSLIKEVFKQNLKISLRLVPIIVIIVIILWEAFVDSIGGYISLIYSNTMHPLLISNANLNYYQLIFISAIFFVIGLIIQKRIYINKLFFWSLISNINNLDRYLGEFKKEIYLEMIRDVIQIQQKAIVGNSAQCLNKFINSFFCIIFKYYGVNIVNSGGIILRDRNEPEFLSFWKMSQDQNISSKKFFIGKSINTKHDKKYRGTAGTVYLEKKPRIVKIIDRKTGVADDSSFHNFNIDRPIVPYASFICLPIIWNEISVGVLSIESQEIDSFSKDDMIFLVDVSKLLGEILFHYELIYQ